MKKDPLWNDAGWIVTPRMLLMSLDYARQELNYSNYDCDKFDRCKKLIRRYIREHKIPLGPTRATVEYRARKKLAKVERG